MNTNEVCPVAATLDLIGGKYKALILWYLSDGRRRFSELRKMIASATPQMLTQQIREPEAQHPGRFFRWFPPRWSIPSPKPVAASCPFSRPCGTGALSISGEKTWSPIA